jgi:hypothetical protein
MAIGSWPGFFVKPLLVAGHDSVWYWTRARAFNQKGQKWNAYFYYTTAPIWRLRRFPDQPNLEKLNQEAAAPNPTACPGPSPWWSRRR